MTTSERWREMLKLEPVVPESPPPPSVAFRPLPNAVEAALAEASGRLLREVKDPGEPGPGAVELARELGLTLTVADLLDRRGFVLGEATARYLEPKLAHLSPPDAMADREAAADRLARAVRAREKICVFGDYDCDGITSAAVMTQALRTLGGHVTPLLATRMEGSYGLSDKALARVLATGATLLVTCDCGSSDHERLEAAREAGLDAIVIDHHLVPDEPLPVRAFLNPHRPECGFAYKGLASCGLALSLAAALRQKLGVTLDLRPLLDLVAVGTIADVAPLDGDNRALVRAGLGVVSGGHRPGLRALASLCRLPLGRPVSGEDVAFKIAPRLNAPGRLGHPDLALELLLERNARTADAIASKLEQITAERRKIQQIMLAEALADVEERGDGEAPAIVVARQGWHPGIVGIVAGRLASRYGKPAIVVALEGERGRGSVRGPSGFPLHDALRRCKDGLVGFGGHQAAAGVEARANQIERLRELFAESCKRIAASGQPSSPASALAPEVRLDARDDPSAVVRDVLRLEPCGERNRAPLVLLRGARLVSARNLKGHLRVELELGRTSLGGFGGELGPLAGALPVGKTIDVVGRLRRDAYRGEDAVEVGVEAIAASG